MVDDHGSTEIFDYRTDLLSTASGCTISSRACSRNNVPTVLSHHRHSSYCPHRPSVPPVPPQALALAISFVSASILPPLTVTTQPMLPSLIAIRFLSAHEAASLPLRAPHSGRASQPRTYLTTTAREAVGIEPSLSSRPAPGNASSGRALAVILYTLPQRHHRLVTYGPSILPLCHHGPVSRSSGSEPAIVDTVQLSPPGCDCSNRSGAHSQLWGRRCTSRASSR